MRTQIFVEGFELDLTDDIACEISYVIDDVKDFGSKNTSYSKTIVIQGSQRNNKIFNHISELGRFIAIENVNPSGQNVNENYTAASGSQCSIFINNIQIFKGKIRVLEVKKYAHHVEYECAVFGELGGFYFELNKGGNGALKRRLQDLDLSDLDHVWNLTNIQNSWTNRNTTPGIGYYYPLIDYGNVSPVANKLDFEVTTFRPAVYVKELIDRIFIASGYTYQSAFLNSDLFKRLVIPNNADKLYTPTNTLINANGSYSTTSTITSFRIPFNSQFILDSQFTDIGGTHTQFKYTGANTINTIIQVPFNLEINGVNGQVSVELQINGVIKDVKYYSYYNFIQNISSQLNYNGQLNTNDVIQVNVSVLFANLYTFNASASLFLTTELQRLQAANFSLSPKLVASAYVPQNIACADFFTSLLKMFNLYVVEDKNISKKLIIEPYIDFYTNEAIDWTDKLDRSQELSLKPMGELNHRYYKFKYKEDSDYWNEIYKKKYNETYGDWTWDTEFEFAQDDTSLELIFSPTVSYSPNLADKHVASIYKLDSSNVETPMSSNIRILQTKNITVPTWHIKNGGNILTTTNFPYAGMFDEPSTPTNTIGWEVPREVFYSFTGNSLITGLFNGFWSQYFAEISDPNSTILTASFWLTSMDIRTLDFAKNILIDGTMWRINKVDNYDPLSNRPTKVELLKVIDTIY